MSLKNLSRIIFVIYKNHLDINLVDGLVTVRLEIRKLTKIFQ